MSYKSKRKRFIRDIAVGRFIGSQPAALIENDLPFIAQEYIRRLREEIGQLNQALGQRNLDLLEARRELRVLHAAIRKAVQ